MVTEVVHDLVDLSVRQALTKKYFAENKEAQILEGLEDKVKEKMPAIVLEKLQAQSKKAGIKFGLPPADFNFTMKRVLITWKQDADKATNFWQGEFSVDTGVVDGRAILVAKDVVRICYWKNEKLHGPYFGISKKGTIEISN